MIITCEECKSSFKLDENLLKPTGSKVRCSKCNRIFTAYPPEISEEAEKPIENEVVTDKAIDDLELDLDSEMASENKEMVTDHYIKAEAEKSDELDLSDLEDLLDKEKEAENEGVTEEAVEDLDLDLEMSLETDGEIKKTPEFEELDELDLSDLEDILDLDEPMAKKEVASEDIELELDMETEPELEHVQGGVESENLDAVDLSELEKMLKVEEDTALEKETEEKEIELELDMEEVTDETEVPEDSSQVDDFELAEADDTVNQYEPVDTHESDTAASKFVAEEGFQDDELEEGGDEEPVSTQMAAAKKRRVSKPLVVLLILVLLGGGAYGTYVLTDYMNIKLPYVSDYFKPKASDPSGNLKIETLDINSKFILNVKEGKLFVITGRIKNGYSDVRRYININGKLFTKGKNLAQKETVFCGNVLSDIELSNLELEAIKKRLSNRMGDNKSNMEVKPGGELPFMIVFSNLPEDLEEFSVEVEGSTSV